MTQEQYELVADCFPKQRGNVKLSNLEVLNAILYVTEHGCKWQGLPTRFGNWHTIYMRMNRWAKNGVLDRVFERLAIRTYVRLPTRLFRPGHDPAQVRVTVPEPIVHTTCSPAATSGSGSTIALITWPRARVTDMRTCRTQSRSCPRPGRSPGQPSPRRPVRMGQTHVAAWRHGPVRVPQPHRDDRVQTRHWTFHRP